jgi:hypothetical protein
MVSFSMIFMGKDITTRLVGANVIKGCEGSCKDPDGSKPKPVDALVHSFEDGATQVICPYSISDGITYCNSIRTDRPGLLRPCFYYVAK